MPISPTPHVQYSLILTLLGRPSGEMDILSAFAKDLHILTEILIFDPICHRWVCLTIFVTDLYFWHSLPQICILMTFAKDLYVCHYLPQIWMLGTTCHRSVWFTPFATDHKEVMEPFPSLYLHLHYPFFYTPNHSHYQLLPLTLYNPNSIVAANTNNKSYISIILWLHLMLSGWCGDLYLDCTGGMGPPGFQLKEINQIEVNLTQPDPRYGLNLFICNLNFISILVIRITSMSVTVLSSASSSSSPLPLGEFSVWTSGTGSGPSVVAGYGRDM